MSPLSIKDLAAALGMTECALYASYVRPGIVKETGRIGKARYWDGQGVVLASAAINEFQRVKAERREEKRNALAARASELAESFKTGQTLEQIGIAEGITRERVRQLLKMVGVSKLDGGGAKKAADNRARRDSSRKDDRERRCMAFYGCDLATFLKLTKEVKFTKSATNRYGNYDLAPNYYNHKWNAIRSGNDWAITLPQYAEFIWPRVLDFGQGSFHLARKDKRKGFEIDNVEIISAQENGRRTNGFAKAHIRLMQRTNERRQAALKLYESGMTEPQIAKRFKVSEQSIAIWLAIVRKTQGAQA